MSRREGEGREECGVAVRVGVLREFEGVTAWENEIELGRHLV